MAYAAVTGPISVNYRAETTAQQLLLAGSASKRLSKLGQSTENYIDIQQTCFKNRRYIFKIRLQVEEVWLDENFDLVSDILLVH